jgi:hypothetical protein
MKDPTETAVKLNIFALPSQTSILFGLIIAVVLGTLFAGSIIPSPIPIWPLALGLLILSLRNFLARPEHESTRYRLSPAGDDLPGLQQAVKTHAERIGLRLVPRIMVSLKEELTTFGTPRHWYIAISHSEALHWQECLMNPDTAPAVEARLIHELYHFKTGDYWQIGYIGELLRLTFLFIAWAAIFLLGFGFLIFVTLPDLLKLDIPALANQIEVLTPEVRRIFVQLMPSPIALEAMRQKMISVNQGLVLYFTVSALLPFVMMGGILWGLYWPKLWRMRELYADAGIVHIMGEVMSPFLAASADPGLLPSFKKYPPAPISIPAPSRGWRQTIKELRWYHPSWPTRIACIGDPSLVFDNWIGTAVLVGSLVLLLDILMNSPLTLFYVGAWPMHFSTLVVLVLVSLSLIPTLVQGKSAWADLLKIVFVVVALRLGWLLLTIGLLVALLIFAPSTLSEVLAAAVASTAHFAGYSGELTIADLSGFVMKAAMLNLAQVVIVFVILVIVLVSVTFLLRRLLTWYRLPQASQRLMRIGYSLIGLMALLLGLTILPPVTTALLRPAELLNPAGILICLLGLIACAIGFVLFLYADRRYSQRCPKCGKSVPGLYHLGKRCPRGDLLHPWLTVEYKP